MSEKKENEAMHDAGCTMPHTLATFAKINGVSTRTVYRWKKKGMPVSSTTGRVICKTAREWLSGCGSK
jgi:hypothetical protein